MTLKKKSTILLAVFPYLAEFIISISGCVACNDLWPWPIFSRSFGLDLENRVRSLASTVLDGFFPYLIQMITSMRRCVTCDDLWPWPISSRSFDLDFENRVRSVTFSVLDRFFPYLPQIITTIRGCVACYVYKFQFFANFSNFWAFTLFWLGIQYELVNSMDLGFKMNWPIVWVIMGRRGYPQNAGCSSLSYSQSKLPYKVCMNVVILLVNLVCLEFQCARLLLPAQVANGSTHERKGRYDQCLSQADT